MQCVALQNKRSSALSLFHISYVSKLWDDGRLWIWADVCEFRCGELEMSE